MKALIKALVERAGIYYAKRRFMPSGIDWLWDIQRLTRNTVKIVFDVGANVGQTTTRVKARFQTAEVHAFEPVSRTYVTLANNVGHLGKVACHHLALCERVGKVKVTAAQDPPLNHLLQDDGPLLDSHQVELVDCETVDHWCALNHVERIDILKVDAEGADLRVLQGATTMLNEGRVAFVLVEAGFGETDDTHVHFPRIYDFLTTIGLRPFGFYDYCHEDEDLGLVCLNVLFISPAGLKSMQ